MPPNKPAPPPKNALRALSQAQSNRAPLPTTAIKTLPPAEATDEALGSEVQVDEWVPVARVIDAWGLAGWIKLDVFGDTQRSVLSKARHWRLSPSGQGIVLASPQGLASPRARQPDPARSQSPDTAGAQLPDPAARHQVDAAKAPVRSSAAAYVVMASRVHGASWIAQLKAVIDRDQALALKGHQVAIRRSDFPRLARGEYYWVDLIGCSVFNRDNELLGTVIAMDDHGAHPMLQVKPTAARDFDEASSRSAGPGSFYIPFVKHFIDRVSIETRRIEVDWLADWS